MTKFCLLRLISQEQYIMQLLFVVHKCKMIISPGVFLFFKILILGLVWRVKGQKMAQNDKKLCPLYFKSQEPYMIWSWFRIHMCKRHIVIQGQGQSSLLEGKKTPAPPGPLGPQDLVSPPRVKFFYCCYFQNLKTNSECIIVKSMILKQ